MTKERAFFLPAVASGFDQLQLETPGFEKALQSHLHKEEYTPAIITPVQRHESFVHRNSVILVGPFSIWSPKLEMLGSIVSRLASPRTILGENFLSTQDGIKHPEMHKKVKVGKFFWR